MWRPLRLAVGAVLLLTLGVIAIALITTGMSAALKGSSLGGVGVLVIVIAVITNALDDGPTKRRRPRKRSAPRRR